MATLIVACDACGTKNRVDETKLDVSRCGRCQNPLLDAAQEQLGLNLDADEQVSEDDPDEEDDSSKSVGNIFGVPPHIKGQPATPGPQTIADVMRDLFGDAARQIQAKWRCKKCGRMFIAPASPPATLCEICR